MDYDHHYKWVGRAAASTDCHTGPQTLEQLRFLTESERWKPSKDQLRDKSFHDFWMNRLVETAKPAIDNALPPAVVRYADYRRANPTGKTSVVEAYARKKLVQNHKDNLKKMKCAIDMTPPARAVQHQEQCNRQPYTRTGVLKRPLSQQGNTLQRRLEAHLRKGWHPILDMDLSDEAALPARRPSSSAEASGRPTTAPTMDIGGLDMYADKKRMSNADTTGMPSRRPLESAGSAVSSGEHLPIAAARQVLEGHALDRRSERKLPKAPWRTRCEDPSIRAAAKWPPEVPGDSEAELPPPRRPSSSKASLEAHQQWLATAPGNANDDDDDADHRKAAEAASNASVAARAAAEQPSLVDSPMISPDPVREQHTAGTGDLELVTQVDVNDP